MEINLKVPCKSFNTAIRIFWVLYASRILRNFISVQENKEGTGKVKSIGFLLFICRSAVDYVVTLSDTYYYKYSSDNLTSL